MEYDNLLALYNRDVFVNDVLTPAWYEYDKKMDAIFRESTNGDRFISIREAAATFVSHVAYELMGMNLAKKMSNPVIEVSSDDAIDLYLAEKEGVSLFEVRKIEQEDKKLILRDKIKEEAKKVFEGDYPLISDKDIDDHTPFVFSGKPYGVEEIKKELFR